MFSSGPNYNKLKTNLRLSVNRLKLLEKKKTELAQKSRKEIADFLSIQKADRARIRVEHIIREDYLVEAMEVLEMFCDLILARIGLVSQLKELDDGISEAVSSIIWVAPRLQADVPELKVVSDILTTKYGKPFADACRAAVPPSKVAEKLQHKMSIQAPPKLLVEKYLIEIAKIYNIEYEPDPQVMKDDARSDGFLIDLDGKNNLDGGIPQPPGFIGYPQPPPLPIMPHPPSNIPFNYPPGPSGGGGGGGGFAAPPMTQPNMNYNIPPNNPEPEKKDLNVNMNFINEEKNTGPMPPSAPNYPPPSYASLSPDDNMQNYLKPKPQPQKVLPDAGPGGPAFPDLPNLPNVPSNLPDTPEDKSDQNDEIDFDDLTKRFEELKKRH
jgi:vacuolar protein sorting-associated protein IST1